MKFSLFPRLPIPGVLLALLAVAISHSQNAILMGAIIGRVTDRTGAVLPGTPVVARNLNTGVERSATANHAGLYQLPALMPGTYSITASAKGFKDFEALVLVQVGNTTVQDIKFQAAGSQETVSVIASPLLRPTESSSSTVLDRSLLEGLPLNGRKYTNFTMLTPNTSYDGDTGLVSVAGQQGGEDSGYANGNGSNGFTVDGSNASSNYFADIVGRNRIPYLYGEDSIQEFQVSVSPYSAVYGGGAGFVNTVTRSGSNAFHGSAFYYNRNSATGANDAIDKAAGFPKPLDALQQFGAGAGGPILRNRLWFFVDYEQQLRNNPISVINTALATTPANLPAFLSANFGIPAGTTLPPPNGPLPIPGSNTAPDPTNPVYLQQVSNTVNALNSNLGTKARERNDWVLTPRLDFQASPHDALFLSLNLNRFSSPGGVITDPTVANYGTQTLANAYVHTFQASLGWTHTFSSNLLNEFHAATSQDNEITTPTGSAGKTPTIILDSPAAFVLGNAPFSVGGVFERQYSFADRIDYSIGKHTLQFDFNRAWDSDNNDGGADPNEAVEFGSFLGSYEFSNLEDFALGEYNVFSQTAGNPTFHFAVPYYGFYVQDTFRALPKLTIEMGLREDFQVYPQPAENPAHWTVSEPVSTPGAAPRIFLAARIEDRGARRIRGLLYQHERAELPQRRGLERAGLTAIFGKCQLHRWSTEPATPDVSEYPSG